MEEKNTIPTTEGEAVTPEATAPDKPGPEPILTTEEAAILEHEGQAALFEMGEFVPDPGDVVVSVEKIEELLRKRRESNGSKKPKKTPRSASVKSPKRKSALPNLTAFSSASTRTTSAGQSAMNGS